MAKQTTNETRKQDPEIPSEERARIVARVREETRRDPVVALRESAESEAARQLASDLEGPDGDILRVLAKEEGSSLEEAAERLEYWRNVVEGFDEAVRASGAIVKLLWAPWFIEGEARELMRHIRAAQDGASEPLRLELERAASAVKDFDVRALEFTMTRVALEATPTPSRDTNPNATVSGELSRVASPSSVGLRRVELLGKVFGSRGQEYRLMRLDGREARLPPSELAALQERARGRRADKSALSRARRKLGLAANDAFEVVTGTT